VALPCSSATDREEAGAPSVTATATLPRLAPAAASVPDEETGSSSEPLSAVRSPGPSAATDTSRGADSPAQAGASAHTIAPGPVGIVGLSLGKATLGPTAAAHALSGLGVDQPLLLAPGAAAPASEACEARTTATEARSVRADTGAILPPAADMRFAGLVMKPGRW
jgi:hypothetical protein